MVLIAVIAVIPRRENLTLGEAKAKPPTSRATGGKPPHGDYNTNNRFLVATRLWEFVKIGSSKLTRRRR